MTTPTRDGPPRALLIAATVLAVGAVVALLVVAALRHREPAPQPVAIAAVPAPQADGADCRALLHALPDQLGDYHRAPTADPTPAGAAAWQSSPEAEPVILRCGLDRPSDFVVGAPIQVVDAVQWFSAADPTGGRATWFTVDRPVYLALTLPSGSGPTPIQEISELVAKVLPATPIDPGPPR